MCFCGDDEGVDDEDVDDDNRDGRPVPRGGGIPLPMKHPPSPAQPHPAKMVETGEQWRGKIRFTLSNLFNSGNP